jgi:hypothetical protein
MLRKDYEKIGNKDPDLLGNAEQSPADNLEVLKKELEILKQ